MASDVQIKVGNVAIGGGAPVVVQSMTLTPTRDVEATTAQIAALASAGCEVVRCAVPKTEDAEALARIVRLSPIPVIADIHFNASLALKAIEAGVAAVRINPGNIGGPDKVELVVNAAKKAGHPDADRRQLRLAAEAPARPRPGRPGRGARRGRDRGGRAARAARLPRLQDLGQVDARADDDPRLPDARRQGAVSAPPRRHRGGHAVLGLDQERRRHGRAALGRDRRHDPRLAHGRPGQGGRDRASRS